MNTADRDPAPVIHFEIPADDLQRAIAFYRDAFGWQVERRDAAVEHWNATFGAGGINGAFVRRGVVEAVTNTIAVDDLAAAMAAVERLGGRIEGDVIPLAGVGRFCYARDSEGNLFGMLQRS